MADDTLDTVSNLTHLAGLSYSPHTERVINNCVESMLQDAPLDCDANAEVLSGAETETLLENVEMSTSTPVPAETKKKKKKKPSKPTKIAAKRQKAQATCKGSMCVMQRAVRKYETTPQENASQFDSMPT